jgi:hypothetical protein
MDFRTKFINGSQLVQLVQSYRNSDGLPRQRVIVSLGDAKLPTAEKSLIATEDERRIHGEGAFFDSSLSQQTSVWVDRIVERILKNAPRSFRTNYHDNQYFTVSMRR